MGNFGFTGSECKGPAPTSNSVSMFLPNGTPRSPDSGYLDGPLSWPQGIKSDVDGNIWIASCGNDSLVMYPRGNHNRAKVVGTSIGRAFDVAQNAEGNVLVTSNGKNQVFGFTAGGDPLPDFPVGDDETFSLPLGAASDSLGNVWVSNSGLIPIPCSSDETLEVPEGDDALLQRLGRAGGPRWLARALLRRRHDDPLGHRRRRRRQRLDRELRRRAPLPHLWRAREHVPGGAAGAALSPDDRLRVRRAPRNTGVQVDSVGQRLADEQLDQDPGADRSVRRRAVVYLGMAAPVKTPLIGTPQKP